MSKIQMVKFYQGIMLGFASNVTSISANAVKTVQVPKVITIEKTAIGVMVTTNDTKTLTLTEIPFNNVQYISYESQEVEVKNLDAALKKTVSAKTLNG